MKYLFSFSILVFCALFSYGQDDTKAKVILDKTVDKIKSYPAVEIDFTLSMVNKEENIKETHKGLAFMKDNMYKIEVMDVVNYFDGEVIYTYMPDVEEVNIKDPDDNQDELMNPTILFDIHNQKFGQKLIEEKNGKAHIVLTPKTRHKQIEKIDVWINTGDNKVEKVYSHGLDGNDIEIVINSLKKPAQDVDVNFFRFDKSAHPDVEVIDLR